MRVHVKSGRAAGHSSLALCGRGRRRKRSCASTNKMFACPAYSCTTVRSLYESVCILPETICNATMTPTAQSYARSQQQQQQQRTSRHHSSSHHLGFSSPGRTCSSLLLAAQVLRWRCTKSLKCPEEQW